MWLLDILFGPKLSVSISNNNTTIEKCTSKHETEIQEYSCCNELPYGSGWILISDTEKQETIDVEKQETSDQAVLLPINTMVCEKIPKHKFIKKNKKGRKR